ncbi:MAG: glycoside hydrolase family 9 protein, partial [Chitinophagaceae bacterium]
MSTAKDVSGGWMDAGDKNKYTTFAHNAVIQLLEAYRINPSVFRDDYNIPESGNGIPDILDELKYELDFLKRMQDATGTNGFMLKVGFDNYIEVSPPSADSSPRYYIGECTSSSIAGCSMFAVAAAVLKNVSSFSTYAQDLTTRAEAAWARIKITTSNYSIYQTDCDDGDIKSGDADHTAENQLDNLFVAAVYLYEVTGKVEYRTFAESNYTKVNPYKINWWGPYWMPQQMALLRLTSLPNVSTTVVNNIRNQKANMNYLYSYPTYDAGTDLYRSYIADDAYHWGHNQARTSAGLLNMDFVTFNINTSSQSRYREVAEQYLHWMHGSNPLGMVMLSNMNAYGAESSANEIYHTWFANGTAWDNALTSSKGPAPGYVPGGPNKNYTGSVTGITTQPPQKAYKDWNSDWPENSWEITEPSIYCQASYIALLSRLISITQGGNDNQAPTAPANLLASNVNDIGLTLSWTAASDNIGVASYEIYKNSALLAGNITSTTYDVTNLNCNTTYSFYVKAKDAAGNISVASNTVNPTTLSCPPSGINFIYDDVLKAGWTNISSGTTLSMANVSPVKNGTNSMKAGFGNNSTVAFQNGSGIPTSSTTQLRFWVYNTGTNGLKVYVVNGSGIAGASYFYKPGKGKWVELVLNMTTLGNPSNIQKIIIQNNSKTGTTMYFDDIRITNVNLSNTIFRIAPVLESSSFYLKVYPNPANHVLNVEYDHLDDIAECILFDQVGKMILRTRINGNADKNLYQMNLPALNSGIYFLQIKTPNSIESRKILIKQ